MSLEWEVILDLDPGIVQVALGTRDRMYNDHSGSYPLGRTCKAMVHLELLKSCSCSWSETTIKDTYIKFIIQIYKNIG